MPSHKAAGSPGAPLLVAKGQAAPTGSQRDAILAVGPYGAAPRAAARPDDSRRNSPLPAAPLAPMRRAAAEGPPPAAALTGAILRERGLAAHVAAGLAEARLTGAELRALRRPGVESAGRPPAGAPSGGAESAGGAPPAPGNASVRLTVSVDKSLHRRLRLAATHLGRPNRDLVAEALADYLDTVAVGSARHCACLARPDGGRAAEACGEPGHDCPVAAREAGQ